MSNARETNEGIIATFHADYGEIPIPYDDPPPMLLLQTIGAESLKKRVVPLRCQPDVTVELGAQTFAATARVLAGDERGRIWDRFVARVPTLATWQATTTRQFPIIELTRVP